MTPQTELDALLLKAYESEGAEAEVNKFYTTFLRTLVYLPIEKIENDHGLNAIKDENNLNSGEPFTPLFLFHEPHIFMMCFDSLERLKNWAGKHFGDMGFVSLLGRDVIRSVGMEVHLCLNYDSAFYKEFSPEEIEKLKQVVGRLDRMAMKNQAK